MCEVIPLYIEDEITGLMVPNVSMPASYMVILSNGQARSITEDYNTAINLCSVEGPSAFIETLPATKRVRWTV